jgi:hypothetical protein
MLYVLVIGHIDGGCCRFLVALYNCGEPGVDTSEVHQLLMAHGRWMMMAHVWTMEAWCMVMETPCKEGHAYPLDITGDLLVLLLLVVVKIPVLPLYTRSLLP